ncbi:MULTISPECIES: sugar ABC transporter permease [Vibrio]|jgi:D-xylose transport system permease protein|uniref:Xylose transport system permease protein XylH n=1 Tax=Vibrio diazotrophicus TaxID=685 RepID=A0A2J8HRG1_VIBDI|nr:MULTISPECIES: sugar ABC transporter permease [Vibrio]MCF7363676.1 sugar ABC transporter permease [Vibrio sp. A1-b2]MCZ4372422.1 sugar ABC transporter permease [Vibrio diazotrophicus]PNI00840.1 sugar ABC transporter permease [Vibrio diazotrophicus]PNI03379.1 sugar ABC transporter permease [Vibrio diazotrophicus]RAS61050.1 xylose ABC transporter membrane protein [Vibrio diazotrophicus]
MEQSTELTKDSNASLLSRLKGGNFQMLVMALAIVFIMIFFSIMTDWSYLTPRNISNLFRQTAITGILAIGMVFVIISGEIDLSVGSMMGLLGGLAAILDVWFGLPLPVTILITLCSGLILGAWNGWWVAYRKVPSFIVTLAGYLAFRGILIGITNGTTVAPISEVMGVIGQSYLPNMLSIIAGVCCLSVYFGWQKKRNVMRKKYELSVPSMQVSLVKNTLIGLGVLSVIFILNEYRGVPTPVLLLTFFVLVGSFIATKSRFGRRIYAIGGNIEASRLSGINVERTKLLVYAMNGFLVAVAGLVLSSRLGAGSPSAGNIAELDAIAACVIGGTSMAGGVGTVFGAVIGAFIMASLDNGMSMMDVPTFWQYIVKGGVLLLAVWMDSAMKKQR